MKHKKSIILILMMALLPSSSLRISADSGDLNLQVGYSNPKDPIKDDLQRSPILIPHVGIESYTLTFYTPCDGRVLQLLDEYGYVVYTTIIPNGATNLVLPSYLSGEYEIHIVQGDFYFYGYINL